MKTVIISPYSQNMRNGKRNPKNYPHWSQLIRLLNENYHTIQIGRSGENIIEEAKEVKFDLKLKDVELLIESCDLWISVDSFLPHLVNSMKNKKPGIVLWSQSDPNVFGYDYNSNLLKSRKFLKSNQFGVWEDCSYMKEAFVDPYVVMKSVNDMI